jgi:hypothetical protein
VRATIAPSIAASSDDVAQREAWLGEHDEDLRELLQHARHRAPLARERNDFFAGLGSPQRDRCFPPRAAGR